MQLLQAVWSCVMMVFSEKSKLGNVELGSSTTWMGDEGPSHSGANFTCTAQKPLSIIE